MSNLQINYSGESHTPTKFVGSSRHFSITIDEPPTLGGTDHGAMPVEYTLASLAGCLNVVAYVIAKELEIEIKSLKIHVEGTINPDKFLIGDFTDRAGFKDISVKLDVDSDADPALLNKWLEVVEARCPVSDNLMNPTSLNLTLA